MQTHGCEQELNSFEDEVFVQFRESENTFVWFPCATLAWMVTALCRKCKLFRLVGWNGSSPASCCSGKVKRNWGVELSGFTYSQTFTGCLLWAGQTPKSSVSLVFVAGKALRSPSTLTRLGHATPSGTMGRACCTLRFSMKLHAWSLDSQGEEGCHRGMG